MTSNYEEMQRTKPLRDRCEKCKYRTNMQSGGNFKFHGCGKRKNKWIIEIEECNDFEIREIK